MTVESAIGFLSQRPSSKLFNIDMIEPLRLGTADIVAEQDGGLLLSMAQGPILFLHAKNEESAAALLNGVDVPQNMVLHQLALSEFIRRLYPSLQEFLSCRQAAYFGTEPIAGPDSDVAIRPLGELRVEFICHHYSTQASKEYILSRLRAGTVFGAFVEHDLAGFIGVHEEGSIGMLEVLPAYRRRGIGYALGVYLTNQFLANGLVPFGQIALKNMASVNLYQKLGYEISKKKLLWLENKSQ